MTLGIFLKLGPTNLFRISWLLALDTFVKIYLRDSISGDQYIKT